VKAGQASRLPGTSFDHLFAPATVHDTRARGYWNRYGDIYNAVVRVFEIPCELLVAISCQETGAWSDNPTDATRRDQETNVIRMEPLRKAVTAITSDPTHQSYLNLYLAMAGGVGGSGANANIPIPWNGGSALKSTTTLTWDQLTLLINTYPNDVLVSPGMMQTVIRNAQADLTWIAEIYGPTYITSINFLVGTPPIRLTADALPVGQGPLFSRWLGLNVDATGATTTSTSAAVVNANLTRMKRALHDIIAGAAHIKRNYNIVDTGRTGRLFNKITDFDWPTVASGHNDGANVLRPRDRSIPGDTDPIKWAKLFHMLYNDKNYPSEGTRYFNAAINYFNAGPAILPALRLWRE
jgi:hypothetical protein